MGASLGAVLKSEQTSCFVIRQGENDKEVLFYMWSLTSAEKGHLKWLLSHHFSAVNGGTFQDAVSDPWTFQTRWSDCRFAHFDQRTASRWNKWHGFNFTLWPCFLILHFDYFCHFSCQQTSATLKATSREVFWKRAPPPISNVLMLFPLCLPERPFRTTLNTSDPLLI